MQYLVRGNDVGFANLNVSFLWWPCRGSSTFIVLGSLGSRVVWCVKWRKLRMRITLESSFGLRVTTRAKFVSCACRRRARELKVCSAWPVTPSTIIVHFWIRGMLWFSLLLHICCEIIFVHVRIFISSWFSSPVSWGKLHYFYFLQFICVVSSAFLKVFKKNKYILSTV